MARPSTPSATTSDSAEPVRDEVPGAANGARHRAAGGRGFGREPYSSGPVPTAGRGGVAVPGRHRAPDATPPPHPDTAVPRSSGLSRPPAGFADVPAPRRAGPGEAVRGEAVRGGATPTRTGPGDEVAGAGPGGPNPFRPVVPTTPPRDAVPARDAADTPEVDRPSDAAAPREAASPAPPRSSSRPGAEFADVPAPRPDALTDPYRRPLRVPAVPVAGPVDDRVVREPITLPIRRPVLDDVPPEVPADRSAAVPRQRDARPEAPPAPSTMQPLVVRRAPIPGARPAGTPQPSPAAYTSGSPAASRADRYADGSAHAARPQRPQHARSSWQTPPAPPREHTRTGLAAIVVGTLGILVGLAPLSGLLPRVLPATALGSVPVFGLVGALLGVVALGLGGAAMIRARASVRALTLGVVGACAGAAAIITGLVA